MGDAVGVRISMKSILSSRWSKVFVFVLCLVPAIELGWRALYDDLGPNPIEFITHFTGDFIMLGLFAFFYAFLHFLTWIGLDKLFDFRLRRRQAA